MIIEFDSTKDRVNLDRHGISLAAAAGLRGERECMRKVRIILPTVREDRAINRGIKADPDTYELSDAQI